MHTRIRGIRTEKGLTGCMANEQFLFNALRKETDLFSVTPLCSLSFIRQNPILSDVAVNLCTSEERGIPHLIFPYKKRFFILDFAAKDNSKAIEHELAVSIKMELVKHRHSLFCNDYKLRLLLCPPWLTGRADPYGSQAEQTLTTLYIGKERYRDKSYWDKQKHEQSEQEKYKRKCCKH